MQHNNNMNIANELDVISQRITELDKSNVLHAMSEIHNAHLDIEKIAREYEISTLLAIIHWVDLSAEPDEENIEQIASLLTNDCYSNWIDVFVSILKEYNDNLRPILHQTLTSPNWIVKPSMVLLKDVACWLENIKSESENEIQERDDTLEHSENNDSNIEVAETNLAIDEVSHLSDSDSVDDLDKVIKSQVLKAEKANEDSLIHQTVFENIEREDIDKEYVASHVAVEMDALTEDLEEYAIPLFETEKSNIDDDQFETLNADPKDLDIDLIDQDMLIDEDILSENHTLIEKLLSEPTNLQDLDEAQTVRSEEDNSFNDINFEIELTDIHNSLKSIAIPKKDIFSAKDKFTKQLDRFALIVENTNLSTISPIIDWCERNLMLFEENTNQKIEEFITSGNVWSWIEQIISCLNGSDKHSCINDLTECLMHKEWLEPLEANDLQALLVSLKEALNTRNSDVVEEANINSSSVDTTQHSENSDNKHNNVTEFIDDQSVIENHQVDVEYENTEDEIKQSSGLQMTWNDDTHPELLMVYLEETPVQIDELIPLLDKISNQTANKDEKYTAARLAHTIKGGSAVVGISALADIAGHLETLLDHSVSAQLNTVILRKLPEIGICIKSTLEAVQLQLEEPAEFLDILTHLESYDYDSVIALDEVASITENNDTQQVEAESDHEDRSVQTDSIETELTENIETINSDTEEVISTEKSNFQMNWNDDTHPELLMVYLDETPKQITELVTLLHKISENNADSEEKHTASRMAHTIKGGSAIVGITTLSEMSYRLETLLDHSVKKQLPTKVLDILPNAASCLEAVFEAVQLQEDEPTDYFSIFTELDTFVNSIDEIEDETLELPTPDLPDFIINQNKVENEEINKPELESVAEVETETEIESIEEIDEIDAIDAESEVEEQTIEAISTETLNLESESITDKDNIKENNDIKESLEVETIELQQLRSKEDVNNIIVEIDNIVLNLISHAALAQESKDYAEKCSAELQRFELITDISGYPELSLLSQWCLSNLEIYSHKRDKNFAKFVISNEIWAWVEHIGACLRESDDMSHMSSLSVELMREEWLEAIKMEDLQTVLLALRHLEGTEIDTTETPKADDSNVDEVISWDKDVHPELLAVYFQETPDQIDQVAALLHKISRGESNTSENKEAARIAHTIKGSSGVVGLNSLLELTHHLEDILEYSVNNEIDQATADLLSESSDCMESLFETIQNKQAPPAELKAVLENLSVYSGKLTKSNTSDGSTVEQVQVIDSEILNNNEEPKAKTKSEVKAFPEKSVTSTVDLNEAYIRVPIKVIDKLLNLAGELVTTSNQVSDNLAKTQETSKTIRNQDERVISMLSELNKTIEQQEKDQQHLFSSIDNSDFDSLEMDTYNELNSVASLLSESIIDGQEIDNTLNKQLDELKEKLHSLDKLNKSFSDVILSSRMVSINTIVPRLERIVRQTCRKTNKKAQLVVTGNNINVDTDILNNLVDPLLHMLRNSIDHGIETPAKRIKKGKDETGFIELAFKREGNNIVMTLVDDGAGINPEKIYNRALEKELITSEQELSDNDTISLILLPGFTTQDKVTDISGRGIGMDVVNTSIQDLNGNLSIASDLGESTRFKLTIPLTLITNTTLLVKVEDNTIAIPTDSIEQIMYQEANTLIERDDEYFISYMDEEIKTHSLGDLLHWPHQMIDQSKSCSVLIVKTDDGSHAVHVDTIVSSREVVVKRLSPWISPARGVIGACHLNDGGVAPVINLVSVVKAAATNKRESSIVNNTNIAEPEIKKQILVVDDSLSNRKALSLIIEKTEYDVVTAVDGLDALQIMNEKPIDLVFTDLEMPRMNGLELVQSIRAWNDKSTIPIVMITSRTTNKHRELAKKAGVDDYLTKPVETQTLLKAIDTWLTNKEALAV